MGRAAPTWVAADPYEASGAQCQRVCAARTLALKPRVIIADGPSRRSKRQYRSGGQPDARSASPDGPEPCVHLPRHVSAAMREPPGGIHLSRRDHEGRPPPGSSEIRSIPVQDGCSLRYRWRTRPVAISNGPSRMQRPQARSGRPIERRPSAPTKLSRLVINSRFGQ